MTVQSLDQLKQMMSLASVGEVKTFEQGIQIHPSRCEEKGNPIIASVMSSMFHV